MQTKNIEECRHHRLRDAYRNQIGELGVFIEGTLSSVRRPGRSQLSWQLTFKQEGKTRTVYVPKELVPEVKQWVKEYKKLKILMRKITNQNLLLLRRHGLVRRAASRAQHPREESLDANSSRLHDTVSPS